MRFAKPWWLMLLMLALWLMATLSSPSVGRGQPKYGGTLVMVHTDPDLMNPVATPGWIQFQRMSFNGLIDYDAQGNIVPGLATSSLRTAGAIITEASLSFLGVGDPNVVSLGQMLINALQFMRMAWWIAMFPGLTIFVIVLALNLVGDGLNDALNPRLKAR